MPKQQTTVDFAEIFKYAEIKHGVQWNPCNDLFFRTEVIQHRGATNFYLFNCLPDDPRYNDAEPGGEVTEAVKQMVSSFSTSNEEVCSLIKSGQYDRLSEIANLIINQFAIDNKLDGLDEFLIV
jgi:hypothetical protein